MNEKEDIELAAELRTIVAAIVGSLGVEDADAVVNTAEVEENRVSE